MIDVIVPVTQYYDYDALTYKLNVKLRNKDDRGPVARKYVHTADENL